MLELLKKIGLPATVAAVIASLVTVLPILFKIDERYAKAEDLQMQIKKVEEDMNQLSIEVGKLAGTQQVLVSIMSAKVNTVQVQPIEQPKPVLSTVKPAIAIPKLEIKEDIVVMPTKPPVTPEEAQVQLETVNRALVQTQRKTQTISDSYQTKK